MLSLRRIERLVSLQSGPEVLGKAVYQMRNDTCRNDAGPARKRTQVQVQKDYEVVQMKSSREQFEEWVPAMVDGLPENMARIFEDMLFTAWQASRAAIEIELPWLGKSSLMDTDDEVEAIELQGLTAKAKP